MQVIEEEKDLKSLKKRQFVIFQLAKEEYGIEITQSREIIKPSKITHVPNTADYIRGVINLRGQIVPVIDLKEKFHIKNSNSSDQERIITIEVRDNLIGLVVDGVTEVVWVNVNDIEDAPEINGGVKQEFIEGVGKYEGRLLVLIDLEKLLFEDRKQVM